MNTERLVRIFAGSFILISLFLAAHFNAVALFERPNWLWFTVFVGANLLQSGFTRWCLLEKILIRAGVKQGSVSGTAGRNC